jgi:hypothetical protein
MANTGRCKCLANEGRNLEVAKPVGAKGGGAGGIRTLDRALQPYNGLANRRLQPLGHSSIRADMPDTRASRKRQIQITPKPFTGPIRGAGAPRSARAIPNLTVAGRFRRALARAPARNRGKMIRRRRPAIRFRLNRGFQAAARSHLVLPRPVDASDPRLRSFSSVFALLWYLPAVRRAFLPASHARVPDPRLYNRP